MKIKKLIVNNWPLIVIVVFSAILRLWKLGSIPPHLTPDEASLGYNAYSILKTGRDEYGELLPVIFKSFGDYKPGLYVYLTIPFVALFGLSEFSVRLPSALAGIAAVWILYLIVKELFRDKTSGIGNWKLEILAAALLAASPWHIHFSRGAWEAGLSLTLTLAGIYYFFRALKNQKYLLPSVFLFSITALTYQGAKLATTIPIAFLAIVYREKILKIDKKAIFKALILALIISSPIIFSFLQGKIGRLAVFSVFPYRRSEEYLWGFLDQGQERAGSLTYYLFHSETLNFARESLGRWFNHFSGKFLFFEGDWLNPRHSAPNHGVLLLSDTLLLVVGLVVLARKGLSKNASFILLWLIFSPLPAALSRDQVNAVRALNMVIPLTIVSAIGLKDVLNYIGRMKKSKVVAYTLSGGILAASFIYFLDAYFIHLPVHDVEQWYWGHKQMVNIVSPIQNDYKKVVVRQSYAQPYIYFLFYQRYNPESYQRQADSRKSGPDVGFVESLDNISFESFSWPYPTDKKNTLVVGGTVGIPDYASLENYRLIKEIKYPDGFKTAFRILEVK